jgi:hypothetical protein
MGEEILYVDAEGRREMEAGNAAFLLVEFCNAPPPPGKLLAGKEENRLYVWMDVGAVL